MADPTEPSILRLTIEDIADLYWQTVRRVSNESGPRIDHDHARLPGGASLGCYIESTPSVQVLVSSAAALEIDKTGAFIESREGTDGYTFHSTRYDNLTINWVTHANIGPTIVGGRQ